MFPVGFMPLTTVNGIFPVGFMPRSRGFVTRAPIYLSNNPFILHARIANPRERGYLKED
jgi:hypothetical protein